MHAAIYVRVSTEDQARHGYSLSEQREACRSRALLLGASVTTEYADEGITGKIMDRPGLSLLREAVRNCQVDVIIVRDPDRLSRKLVQQLLLTEEFEKAGVRLEFLDFTWQDTPEGRLFYSIRGAIAEYEREKIRDRMCRGKTQKARQGGIPVGFYAFGYSYSQETGVVSVNESEAAVVKDIFSWFVSEDIGINGVARRLNQAGVPTRKRKGGWHRNVIRQILINPVYIGLWRYKDVFIPVPSLIEEEVWSKTQQKLKDARRLWAGKGRHSYLLSGLITCSDCENTMTGVYATWWGKKERRYTCRKNHQGAKNAGCHPPKAVQARAIENVVWKEVCAWLQDSDALAREAMANINCHEGTRRELERVEKHLGDLVKGREAVLDALSTGLFELDVRTKAKLASLKGRQERLEKRKQELEVALREMEKYSAGLEETRALAEGVLAGLDKLKFEEKKALVRTLVARVAVSGRGRPGSKGLHDIQIIISAKLTEQEISSSFSGSTR
ncbi:recombinase family protein [Pelotomaculum terephthalicicum JT]|uniref:recombinase family protein n=1 Tax=Pelotomaculum TaxID=191373 RepID=UPI0009CDBF7F|nr:MULTISPECIES: recombinase family protein [Pelotomaculum]MCG9969664.1 recombinase family protein [Pelotomaculum terephthalicicum JT]OPX92186.1 MAG: Transposon gamma-delta resolvase [Pelotomaculum sp. PtaB.Bin117]OPY62433.1 MAG: Transposon gamma-delta resolvase [Pelotomaculum sp. PtaU1.Bin065]